MNEQANRPAARRHPDALRRTIAALFTLGAVVALFATAVFAAFAAAVAAGWTQAADEAVLAWMAARRTPLLDMWMVEATSLGNALVGIVLVAVAMLFLWLTKHHWSALLLLVAGLGGTIINNVLKYAIGRPRPDVVEALTTVATPSFPSGHAMNALIMYGSVAFVVGRLEATPLLRRATWTIAAILIAAIGISRIYLGVHYPSDVAAGFVAGAGWLAFIGGAIAALERYNPSR